MLVFEDDTDSSANSHSCRSSKTIISAPNNNQTLNVDPEVFKNDPAGLSSLFKRLLLDENLRENYLKGGSKLIYLKVFCNNDTSFFDNSKIYLPYAEQLILEVSI